MATATAQKPAELPAGPVVDIKTSVGDIKVKLYDDTPRHRDNFLKLVKDGYYNGVLFHRVIKDFMVQTGDPGSVNADSTAMLGIGGPDYQIDGRAPHRRPFPQGGRMDAARSRMDMHPLRKEC